MPRRLPLCHCTNNDRDCADCFRRFYFTTWCPCDLCQALRTSSGVRYGDSIQNIVVDPTIEQVEGQPVNCTFCGDEAHMRIGPNNDILVCQYCRDELPICRCPECETVFMVDGHVRRWHNNECNGQEMICHNCVGDTHGAFTCDGCNTSWPTEHWPRLYITWNEEDICDRCFGGATICNNCERAIIGDDVHSIGRGAYCPTCRSEVSVCSCLTCQAEYIAGNTCSCPADGVFNYMFKPQYLFVDIYKKPVSGRLFLGTELEVEYYGDNKARVARKINEQRLFYCKKDSSVSAGFEVVSHPWTYEWLLAEGHEVFKELFTFFQQNPFAAEGTTTCGMHVHMSKDAFRASTRRSTWYKMLSVVSGDNKDFALMVSERNPSGLNNYSGIPRDKKEALYIARNGSGRTAITISNRKTVEVRLFKGTTEWNRFMKNIQFCVGLKEFAETTSMRFASSDTFCSWIEDRADKYSYLHEFLMKRGYIKNPDQLNVWSA